MRPRAAAWGEIWVEKANQGAGRFLVKLVAVIQARMSSRRLPGKVLLSLRGKPMIQYVMDSVRKAKEVDEVVLATSDETSDDLVADFGARQGAMVVRGPLDDVAGRFLLAASQSNADGIVRICGDSPLLDYRIIDRCARLFRAGDWDMVSNRIPRTFPPGCTVEVIGHLVLQKIYPSMIVEDREHVTSALYQNQSVSIQPVICDSDLSGNPLVVDSAEDFALVEQIFEKMSRPHTDYTLDEVVALRKEVVAPQET